MNIASSITGPKVSQPTPPAGCVASPWDFSATVWGAGNALESESYELVCQVNGRVRDRVLAPSAAERDELEALCLAAPNVRAHIDGKDVLKVVVVPRRLVNRSGYLKIRRRMQTACYWQLLFSDRFTGARNPTRLQTIDRSRRNRCAPFV